MASLGNDLSAVINRVRQAFGPLSMRESACHPQIRRAERIVDRTARQLLRGETDLKAWRQSLRHYEDSWLLLLDKLRRRTPERRAA